MTDIMEQIGLPALLEQLAEECGELTQAALKLARLRRGENPTPKTEQECITDLIEEIADVELCINILILGGVVGDYEVWKMICNKEDRWRKRLEGIPYRKPEILPGPPKDKEAQECARI